MTNTHFINSLITFIKKDSRFTSIKIVKKTNPLVIKTSNGNFSILVYEITDQQRREGRPHERSIQVEIDEITIPHRPKDFRLVFHLYIVFAKDRDGLLEFCIQKGIEAKIHYPIPIYKQSALEHLGYKDGDFPVTDAHIEKIITFPCDQHLEPAQLDFIISTVTEYYEN